MSDLSDLYSEMGSKQRDRRVKRFFTDQFGRRYFAWADKQNQRPIGEFVLADKTGRFKTAPWNPPMSYIEWPDHDGLEFSWKFEALAQELAGYTAEWYSEAQKLAKFLRVPVPETGGDCVPEIIGIMGPPPLSPEIPLACDAGEPWLLGVVGASVNERLETILHLGNTITSTLALDIIRERVRLMVESRDLELVPKSTAVVDDQATMAAPSNYYEFMAAALRLGKSPADAQKEWKSKTAEAA